MRRTGAGARGGAAGPGALGVLRVAVAAAGRRLEAVCVECGPDLVVVVGGGARPHVGASALALSLPSLKDPAHLTQSSYLAAVPGHKEEGLARDGALRLARALRRHVVVTVGIHDDGLDRAGIEGYLALFDRLVERVARAAAAPGREAGAPGPRRRISESRSARSPRRSRSR